MKTDARFVMQIESNSSLTCQIFIWKKSVWNRRGGEQWNVERAFYSHYTFVRNVNSF